MEVYENFTSLSHAREIENVLLTEGNFPWFYSPVTSLKKSDVNYRNYNNVKDTFQFSHLIREQNTVISNFYPLLYPLIVLLEKQTSLNIKDNIIRIKCNLLLKDENFPLNFTNQPHQDVITKDPNIRALLYYVNDSDGDTVIFKENNIDTKTLNVNTKISPRQGKAVLFNSTYLHASTSPRISERRSTVNILFKI